MKKIIFLLFTMYMIYTLGANSQGIASRMLRTKTAQAITISTAFTDTLNLGSTYSVIAIRGSHSTEDTVLAVKGLVSGAIYILSPVADDTTIVLVDGANLKLAGNFRMDALGDRLTCWSDGTTLFELTRANNE